MTMEQHCQENPGIGSGVSVLLISGALVRREGGLPGALVEPSLTIASGLPDTPSAFQLISNTPRSVRRVAPVNRLSPMVVS